MLRLVSVSTLLTGARLLGAIATLVLMLILTRHFGADVAAGFAVCMALAATIATVGLCGLQAFSPILVAEYNKTAQYGHLRGFVLFGGIASIGLTTALVLGLHILEWLGVLSLLGIELNRPLMAAASVVAIAGVALAFSAGVLTGFHKQPQAQLPESLLRPFLMLCAIAVLALVAAEPKLTQVLALAGFASVVAAAVVVAFLWRQMRKVPVAPLSMDTARWVRMAPPWLSIALVWDNMIELLLLLAAALAGATEVVLLHICFRYRVLAGFGMRSLYSVSQPRIYEALAAGDSSAVRGIIGMTNILALIYGAFVLAFVALFADILLGLFGSEFSDGKVLLLTICSLIVIRAIFGPAMAVLGANGAQMPVALILVAALVVAIAASLVLFPYFGVLAIGIAYTGANALSAFALWLLARHTFNLDCAIWAVDFGGAYRALRDELTTAAHLK
ncbi:MAG: lipopolysaccharide biosynthesis protein [Hyphomicrobiales bacterium]